MSVYTDGVHLVGDSIDELHAFAQRLGLKREWFQSHRHPHYDLTTRRAAIRAREMGAKEVSPREVERISRPASPAAPTTEGDVE